MVGMADIGVYLSLNVFQVAGTTNDRLVGIAPNGSVSGAFCRSNAACGQISNCAATHYPSAGLNYYQWMENVGVSTTFYGGNNSSLAGLVVL